MLHSAHSCPSRLTDAPIDESFFTTRLKYTGVKIRKYPFVPDPAYPRPLATVSRLSLSPSWSPALKVTVSRVPCVSVPSWMSPVVARIVGS
ncbi:hypothetical protein E2C01_098285 [Portunus trituberculatus]|uniref:Uncharacterized protein n=1 Tax=Portunus trituberculatus TaxID=210409 RepID=A0A5B7KCI7_PORTR|nr:hypothetical protein [Portunus trituberculatus]